MHDNVSRRHWLLTLLTGLLGTWLRRAKPEAPTAAPAAPPVACSPPLPLSDPVALATTYSYHSSMLAPTSLAGYVATYACDASGQGLPPRGGMPG